MGVEDDLRHAAGEVWSLSLPSFRQGAIADPLRSRREEIAREMDVLWSARPAGQDHRIFEARLADGVDEVAPDDHVGQRGIVVLLTGLEFEGGPLVAPNPVGVAVAEV